MKTAMQKFISGMITYKTDEKMTIVDRMERAEKFIEILRKRAHLLLEAEKEQIIEAYNEGKWAVKCNSDESTEDFFKRTFKSDE